MPRSADPTSVSEQKCAHQDQDRLGSAPTLVTVTPLIQPGLVAPGLHAIPRLWTGAELGELTVTHRAELPARIEQGAVEGTRSRVTGITGLRIEITIEDVSITCIDPRIVDADIPRIHLTGYAVLVRPAVTILVYVVAAIGPLERGRGGAGVLCAAVDTAEPPSRLAGTHPTACLAIDVVLVHGLVAIAIDPITEVDGVQGGSRRAGVDDSTRTAGERPLSGATANPASCRYGVVVFIRGAVTVRISPVACVGSGQRLTRGARVDGDGVSTQLEPFGCADAQSAGGGFDPVVFVGLAVTVRVRAITSVGVRIGRAWLTRVLRLTVHARQPTPCRTLSETARRVPCPKALVRAPITVSVFTIAEIGAGIGLRRRAIVPDTAIDAEKLALAHACTHAAIGLDDDMGLVGHPVAVRVHAIAAVGPGSGRTRATTVHQDPRLTQ